VKPAPKGRKLGMELTEQHGLTFLLEEMGVKGEIKMVFMSGCRGHLILLDFSQKMPKQEARNKFLGNKDRSKGSYALAEYKH